MSRFKPNECYRVVAESTDPNQAIVDIMKCLVEFLPCNRAYIFEKSSEQHFSNTYNAYAKGMAWTVKRFENEPLETVDFVWNDIADLGNIVLENNQNTKRTHPQIYAILNYSHVDRVIFTGIFLGGELRGCLGVDDPIYDDLEDVKTALDEVARLVAICFKRRDVIDDLIFTSFHDSLTGSLNAQAFQKRIRELTDLKSIGILYCDVFGLKRINDMLGHSDGDVAICDCYRSFTKVFSARYIYRIGGDEFVIMLPDVDERSFNRYVEHLLTIREVAVYHFSVGYIWQGECVGDLYDLINVAEEYMYRDKRNNYRTKNRFSHKSGERLDYFSNAVGSMLHFSEDSRFFTYLEDNYVDPLFFFKSITAMDSAYYLYYGDLRTNVFYISENMKRDFGYDDNIVVNFMNTWEERIVNKDDLLLFRTDITDVLQQRSPVHDLRYRVVDSAGNVVWIRCYGHIKWSSDGQIPLCFAGSIARQDKNYLVDPVTNLRCTHAAIQHIESCQENSWSISVIGFALNHFTQINELKGRYAANMMLQRLVSGIDAVFSGKLDFFRLDGMRFIGVGRTLSDVELEKAVQKISDMIEDVYSKNQLNMRFPGSIAVISEVDFGKSAQDVLSDLISLLSVAKKTPMDDYVKYSDRAIESQKNKALLTISLNNDIANDFENFRLVIQPVVSADGYCIESGECLLRWRYEGRDVPPPDYISILEQNMLIIPLGKWVFERAVSICKQAMFYDREIKLAVNVSYYQIMDADFIPFIRRTLQEHYVSGRHIVIELTEMHFIDKPEILIKFIDECAELDIQVALDDFGEGYASLSMLLRYATNIIKLDRSLVRQMSNSKDNINFISSIVYACHKFGKKVCAEGIETELKIVKSTGCDSIQGFFFHRPMEVPEFLQLLMMKRSKNADIVIESRGNEGLNVDAAFDRC